VTNDAQAQRDAVLSARPLLERAEELDRAAVCAAPLRRRALAYACLKAGDLAVARRWMESALATRTGWNEPGEAHWRHGEHTLLGLIALAEGDRARAVEELARSVAVYREHANGFVDFHNELAGALFDAGEREVVCDYLREAGALAPEHRQEELIAGAAVVQSGRKPRAWAFGDHPFVGLGLARGE
jgi:tetratricopeptide (TPR) repeat protein